MADTIHSAFVFIKPHAVFDGVKQLVTERIAAEGMTIKSEGPIAAEKIDKEMLIDTHYGAIASRAMKQKPNELVVQPKSKEEFQKVFGQSWESVLSAGTVFNLVDGAAKLGVTLGELGAKWDTLKKGETLLKFGGGFYCGQVDGIFIINGFYACMREAFTKPGECLYFYEVEWPIEKLSWADFRGKVIGGTDPKTAFETSLRHIIFQKWQALGLAAEPNTGLNGMHASASPFEGLAERTNWLARDLATDYYGKAMIEKGIPADVIGAWTQDPPVKFDGGVHSCFDLLEDLDGADCLAKCAKIFASQ